MTSDHPRDSEGFPSNHHSWPEKVRILIAQAVTPGSVQIHHSNPLLTVNG